MAIVKKINELWEPSEKPNLKVGERIEVTDYKSLVVSGMAVLVDDNDNEVEMPGQLLVCPICFQQKDGLSSFYQHIETHLKKNKASMEEAIKKVEVAQAIIAPQTPAETLKADVAAEVIKQNTELKALEEAIKEETPEEKAAAVRARRIEILAKARAAKQAKK